ncbi:MAG TPA: hypothetical protein VEQ37_11355 [Actinomycetota bacterium]|nr:hypothetical protein [Actinomycetota bacterium]
MPRLDDLSVLLKSARRLAKLCRDGAALVVEARDHDANPTVMAAARRLHSELLRTKHAVEDELVAFVLDCERCGRRVHLAARRRRGYSPCMNHSGMRQVPGPGQLEADDVREQQRELAETAERERVVEAAVPHRRRFRSLLAKLRDKR